MNFYQSVFLEKNFFENIRKKSRVLEMLNLIFSLSDQSNDSKTIFNKNLDNISSL